MLWTGFFLWHKLRNITSSRFSFGHFFCEWRLGVARRDRVALLIYVTSPLTPNVVFISPAYPSIGLFHTLYLIKQIKTIWFRLCNTYMYVLVLIWSRMHIHISICIVIISFYVTFIIIIIYTHIRPTTEQGSAWILTEHYLVCTTMIANVKS